FRVSCTLMESLMWLCLRYGVNDYARTCCTERLLKTVLFLALSHSLSLSCSLSISLSFSLSLSLSLSLSATLLLSALVCISSGSRVSLFTRWRSQTVSTRYLAVEDGSFVASARQWTAFAMRKFYDDKVSALMTPSQKR